MDETKFVRWAVKGSEHGSLWGSRAKKLDAFQALAKMLSLSSGFSSVGIFVESSSVKQ